MWDVINSSWRLSDKWFSFSFVWTENKIISIPCSLTQMHWKRNSNFELFFFSFEKGYNFIWFLTPGSSSCSVYQNFSEFSIWMCLFRSEHQVLYFSLRREDGRWIELDRNLIQFLSYLFFPIILIQKSCRQVIHQQMTSLKCLSRQIEGDVVCTSLSLSLFLSILEGVNWIWLQVAFSWSFSCWLKSESGFVLS